MDIERNCVERQRYKAMDSQLAFLQPARPRPMRDDLFEHPTHHKEESKARIQADVSDRRKLRERLDQCIDPLDPADHSPTLFNIVSGKLDAESANVHYAPQIGKDCRQAYQIEESSRRVEIPDLIVLGSCAILWTINCPISGTLLDLVNAVAAYVHARLMNSDVLLIFDIYIDYSTKGCTRDRRASVTADRCPHLILQSPLPPQSVSLTITDK